MKPVLTRYLRCTNCRGALGARVVEQIPVVLTEPEKQVILDTGRRMGEYESEILTGELVCTGCTSRYPIQRGIPRMYRGAQSDFASHANEGEPGPFKNEGHIQTSFSREWGELNYEDGTIWLWTTDERVVTFCEELCIPSPDVLRGKLMVDAGCGSGILSMRLAHQYSIEIVAMDISHILDRAYAANRSNLCHFIQTTVMDPPLAEGIADITYSHGVLHHTHDTKAAFQAVAKLTKKGGVLYVWLYGRKKGWNRFRFLFIRSARFIIARLPRTLQTVMVYFMTGIHLSVRLMKRLLGMEKVRYKSMSQFLVSIRDKYTPLYAREHTEAEVEGWFSAAGYDNVERRTTWEATRWWKDSTDLSIKGIRR